MNNGNKIVGRGGWKPNIDYSNAKARDLRDFWSISIFSYAGKPLTDQDGNLRKMNSLEISWAVYADLKKYKEYCQSEMMKESDEESDCYSFFDKSGSSHYPTQDHALRLNGLIKSLIKFLLAKENIRDKEKFRNVGVNYLAWLIYEADLVHLLDSYNRQWLGEGLELVQSFKYRKDLSRDDNIVDCLGLKLKAGTSANKNKKNDVELRDWTYMRKIRWYIQQEIKPTKKNK